MSYKLKCCPICGGNVRLECPEVHSKGGTTSRSYHIRCGACGLKTNLVDVSYYFDMDTIEAITDKTQLVELIEQWNGDRFDGYGSDS